MFCKFFFDLDTIRKICSSFNNYYFIWISKRFFDFTGDRLLFWCYRWYGTQCVCVWGFQCMGISCFDSFMSSCILNNFSVKSVKHCVAILMIIESICWSILSWLRCCCVISHKSQNQCTVLYFAKTDVCSVYLWAIIVPPEVASTASDEVCVFGQNFCRYLGHLSVFFFSANQHSQIMQRVG